ncbi:MAG: monovalent cation/H+ antiporter complex subunit F [Micrococcaceae bacterium]
MNSVVFITCIICMAISTTLMLYRLGVGPTLFDRLIASDVLLSIFMGGFILTMAYKKHNYSLSLLLVLSMIGFISAVVVTRFVRKQ